MMVDNTSNQLSRHYEKFFAKFSQIEELPIDEWKAIHLLAYICKRYEQYYNLKFTFSLKSVPSKCREIYEINKLSHQLSSNPKILKDYIDWIFDKKIIERKKRITSLGYFTNVEIVNEYKFKFLFKKMEISRNDILPTNVIVLCFKNGFDIKTYGELAFIKKMPNQGKLFDELENINFKTDVLDKIL